MEFQTLMAQPISENVTYLQGYDGSMHSIVHICKLPAYVIMAKAYVLAMAGGDRVAVHMHGRQHRQELEAVLAAWGANVGGQLPRCAGLALEQGSIARGDQAGHARRLHKEHVLVRHPAVQQAMAPCTCLSC